MQSNFMTGDALSLDRIRSTLIRLEDTIIFAIIERAQFAYNPIMYARGEQGVPELKEKASFDGSWLEWFLKETESFHARARRYTSPDEYPFTNPAELPGPLLNALAFPATLYPNTVNINAKILDLYVRDIVPRITLSSSASAEKADDGNYGSAATLDVELLQALSKRIHFGKFVSESKFRAHPASFLAPIRSGDRETLGEMITKKDVEIRLLGRVRKKALMYGQEVDADGEPVRRDGDDAGKESVLKIDADSVVDFYERYIIPLTKEVEVDYLLQRLDGLTDAEIKELESR